MNRRDLFRALLAAPAALLGWCVVKDSRPRYQGIPLDNISTLDTAPIWKKVQDEEVKLASFNDFVRDCPDACKGMFNDA